MPTDIVLKNKNGEDVTYENIETVTFDTPIENEQVVFTYGTAMSDVEIVPNFSNGDLVIEEIEGVLFKSGVVKKPETLVAENIKSGVEIAGVTGEFIGNYLENVPVALDLAEGNQIITAPDGYLVKSAIIQKPETLLPENIAEGVDIGGVVGTLVGGGSSVDCLEDEYLKYFYYRIDVENKIIYLYKLLYPDLYADTGSYDVTIPDKFGSYSIVIEPNG